MNNINKLLKRENKGFTLIELLVVVTIIGVLTTLITANFVGVRQRARDAQRKSDVRQIQSALELYRADSGNYPIRTSVYRLNTGSTCPASSAMMNTGNTVTYMSKVPCDPLGVNVYNTGNYYYYSDGSTYTLTACLENANDNDQNSTSIAPNPSGGTCTSTRFYLVINP